MKQIDFKNFFKYKWWLSRSWFLLIFIALFLTIISFSKGIQILIFIPAFVLSIFLYSLYEIYIINKSLNFNFFSDKNWNNLKLFVKPWIKYNFIIANKEINNEINFLQVNTGLSYILKEDKDYHLFIYVYWSFDIFRKVIDLWKIKLDSEKEKHQFFISEKYTDWKELHHLDNLKSSVKNIPFIKEEKDLSQKDTKAIHFNIISNEDLKIIWLDNIKIIHFFLIILWSLWIVIEWKDPILNLLIWFWFILILILKHKKWKLKNYYKNIFLLFAFFLMIFMTFKNKDMSWPWSVFLIHILTIVYLFPKDFKNSFLFIFLPLFIFVVISLFSNQIWFIFLFLSYICLSIYLLFFISGTESFDEYKYKIWNKLSKFSFIKAYTFIVSLMFIFFFILPHGNKSEVSTNLNNKQNNVSWFNEDISLENVQNILEDSRKAIVVENISQEKVSQLWIDYFRWKRYNFFDWIKWHSTFQTDINFLNNIETQKENNITLDIKYYLNGSKRLFLPSSPLSINNSDLKFYNIYDDLSVLQTQRWINEPTKFQLTFQTSENGKIIDREKNQLEISSQIHPNITNIFSEYIESIPEYYTKSPELLTQYVKNTSWFTYSTAEISDDIEDFLYWKKQWHCEYFATTLAILFQHFWYSPTLVSGYGYGEYNELANSYIVRYRNAHTWVEIYNEQEMKWEVFDATPGTIFASQENIWDRFENIIKIYDYIDIKWYTYIVNYTWIEQKNTFKYIIENKFKILILILSIIFFYFMIKIFKFIFYIFSLNKKEKILFFLSHKYKTKNNVIDKIRNDDTSFAIKLEKYVYWDEWEIWYKDIFKFLYK